MPRAARVVSTCRWAALAWLVHERSCASVAKRALATRCATDGVCNTTIIRWPSGIAARAPPTRPRQLAAARWAVLSRSRAATLTPRATVRAAIVRRTASRMRLRRGTRIQGKVVGVRDGVDVPRRGRDHRGVVGAERERRERGVRKRRAKLGVRRDAADDGDAVAACGFEPRDERAHDRALIARGEVGPASLELGGREVAHLVEQSRLQP